MVLSTRHDDLIQFVHIPKTAGTSMLSMLRSWFPSQSIFEIGGSLSEARLRIGQRDPKSIQLLAGHMADGPYRPFLRSRSRYTLPITVLRDPTERLLSLFSHITRRTTEPWQDAAATRSRSLEHFLSDPFLADQLDNVQTRMIAGSLNGNLSYGDWRSRYSPEAWLTIAKQRLDRFLFVGITEDMSASCRALAEALGFPIPTETPRLNVTPRSGSVKLDTPEQKLITHLTRLDRPLYEYARSLFVKRVDRKEREN